MDIDNRQKQRDQLLKKQRDIRDDIEWREISRHSIGNGSVLSDLVAVTYIAEIRGKTVIKEITYCSKGENIDISSVSLLTLEDKSERNRS